MVLGHTPNFAKCNEKFMGALSKAEEKAGPGVCVTEGDAAAIEAQIDACMAGVNASLTLASPAGLPLCQSQLATCNTDLATCTADLTTCNSDLIQAEADLSLCTTQLAAAQQFPATGQTTCLSNINFSPVSCGTDGTNGQDGDILAGAALSYTDNGDGTITDNNTRLMWEKKSDDGTIHDKDTTYTWADAFAVHIAGLNAGGGFAGHTDWRVPNVRELQSIVNYENFSPSVSSAFNTGCVASCSVTTCSCTRASYYWSSSSSAGGHVDAWMVTFVTGAANVAVKFGYGNFVRAVRGGL